MGDLDSLLLILAAIYLTECVVWVRRGGIAINRLWGKAWRIWHPGTLLANARGAIFFSNPLPPFGNVLLTHQPGISLSPEAALSFTAACINPSWRPPHVGLLIQWSELKTVGFEGKRVLVNGIFFDRAPSIGEARRRAALLRRLKAMPEKQRASAIRASVGDSLDSAKVRQRWEDYQVQAAPLRWLALILFAYLFAIAPLLLWKYGFRHAGAGVAAGLLVQTICIGWLFRGAHKRLFPDGVEERFTPFFTMLLAPPTAIRAPDILGRHLLEEFHPLAVVHTLAPPEVFKKLARHALLDLEFPILPVSPSSDESVIRTEEWFRAMLREMVWKFVERANVNPEELLRPLAPAEIVHRAFCPRCGAQFVDPAAVCGECGGRALVTFGQAATAGTVA
jgi:hypothetical protein